MRDISVSRIFTDLSTKPHNRQGSMEFQHVSSTTICSIKLLLLPIRSVGARSHDKTSNICALISPHTRSYHKLPILTLITFSTVIYGFEEPISKLDTLCPHNMANGENTYAFAIRSAPQRTRTQRVAAALPGGSSPAPTLRAR